MRLRSGRLWPARPPAPARGHLGSALGLPEPVSTSRLFPSCHSSVFALGDPWRPFPPTLPHPPRLVSGNLISPCPCAGSYWILADRAFRCVLTFPCYLPARPSAPPSCISHSGSRPLTVSLSFSLWDFKHSSLYLLSVAAAFYSFFSFRRRGAALVDGSSHVCSPATLRMMILTFPFFCMLRDSLLLWFRIWHLLDVFGSIVECGLWMPQLPGWFTPQPPGPVPWLERELAELRKNESLGLWTTDQRGFWMQKTRIMLS